jgi:hypothetical protein
MSDRSRYLSWRWNSSSGGTRCAEQRYCLAHLAGLLRQLRTAQCSRPGIEEHVFADEPLGAADRDLQRRRTRLATHVRDTHTVGAHLLRRAVMKSTTTSGVR